MRDVPNQLNWEQLELFNRFPSISIPWCVSNHTLYKNLHTESVVNLIKTNYKKFHSRLHNYSNLLISNHHIATILDNSVRRLKRRQCRDLLDLNYVIIKLAESFQNGPITGQLLYSLSLTHYFFSIIWIYLLIVFSVLCTCKCYLFLAYIMKVNRVGR